MFEHLKTRLTESRYMEALIRGLGLVSAIDTRKTKWKLLVLANNLFMAAMNLLVLESEIMIGGDLVLLAHEMTQAFTIHLSTVKYFVLTRNERQFEEIVFKLHEIQIKYVNDESYAARRRGVEKLSRKIGTLYNVCVAVVTTGYCVMGIVVGLYTTYFTDTPEWLLPVNLHKDLVPSNWLVYSLLYYYHVHTCYIIAVGAVTVETLVSEYQMKICAFLQILAGGFHDLVNRPGHRLDAKEFEKLIHFHQAVIDVTERLSTLYLPIIFSQFIITGVALCFLGFVLMLGVTNHLETFVLLCFALAVGTQPLIYAYAGERIVDESFAVSQAIYASRWYDKSVPDQKLIKFCLMRTQRVLHLRSPFYGVDLETFGGIIKTSFSYITLLRTMLAK